MNPVLSRPWPIQLVKSEATGPQSRLASSDSDWAGFESIWTCRPVHTSRRPASRPAGVGWLRQALLLSFSSESATGDERLGQASDSDWYGPACWMQDEFKLVRGASRSRQPVRVAGRCPACAAGEAEKLQATWTSGRLGLAGDSDWRVTRTGG